MNDLKAQVKTLLEDFGGPAALRTRPLSEVIGDAARVYAHECASTAVAWWEKARSPVPEDKWPAAPDWDAMLPGPGRPYRPELSLFIGEAMQHLRAPLQSAAAQAAGRQPLVPSERQAARAIADVLAEHGIACTAESVRLAWRRWRSPGS